MVQQPANGVPYAEAAKQPVVGVPAVVVDRPVEPPVVVDAAAAPPRRAGATLCQLRTRGVRAARRRQRAPRGHGCRRRCSRVFPGESTAPRRGASVAVSGGRTGAGCAAMELRGRSRRPGARAEELLARGEDRDGDRGGPAMPFAGVDGRLRVSPLGASGGAGGGLFESWLGGDGLVAHIRGGGDVGSWQLCCIQPGRQRDRGRWCSCTAQPKQR